MNGNDGLIGGLGIDLLSGGKGDDPLEGLDGLVGDTLNGDQGKIHASATPAIFGCP